MAFPTILIDSTDGAASDTACSGAGPATAVSGSKGRTRNTASQLRVGFFEASAPDLSGVATDGSHALYIAIATAGQRNFSSIAAVKDTQQTGTGNMTGGSAVITSTDTTNWTAGDVVKVAGVGAAGADFYSTVLTVDSGTQATFNDTCGIGGSGAAFTNPKQVTLTTSQGVNTGTTDTAWAIGGKRATVGGTNSIKLLENNSSSGDAMAGWIIQMASSHAETIAATINIRRAGDTTDGHLTWRGASGAATLPIVTFSNNGAAIASRASNQTYQDFEIRNSNATKTASVAFASATSGGPHIIGIRCDHSTNKFWKFYTDGGSVSVHMRDCTIGNCASVGVTLGVSGLFTKIINNYIHHCGSHGVSITANQVALEITGNIIAANTGDGINHSGSSAGAQCICICNNTFDSNTSDGVEFTLVGTNGQFVSMNLNNNIFSNNGAYGFNCSGATDPSISVNMGMMEGNDFYNNTSGATNPASLTINKNSQTLDPQYTNSATGDFSIGNASLKAKGWPVGGTNYVGTHSTTYSYPTAGAAQPNPSGGGSVVPTTMYGVEGIGAN